MYKSMGQIGFSIKIVPKTDFDRNVLLKYEREWRILTKYEVEKQVFYNNGARELLCTRCVYCTK